MTLDQWRALPFNVLDLETTGVNTVDDRIVQAAFVTFAPGQRPVVRQWLINPGVEIPAGAAEVHGITTERARAEGLAPDVVLFELAGLVALALGHGIPLVAFNAAFDLTMVEAECTRHGVDTLAARLDRGKVAPVLDPFVLDKQISRRRGKRTLGDQCRHYTVPHTGAHDAAGDALATGRLLPKVLAAAAATKAHAEIVDWTPRMLHEAQIGWRREQCDSLRSYFDKQGIEHDGVDGSWPINAAAYSVERLAGVSS
jgi:DNA polymerase-3 subunit epsilon